MATKDGRSEVEHQSVALGRPPRCRTRREGCDAAGRWALNAYVTHVVLPNAPHECRQLIRIAGATPKHVEWNAPEMSFMPTYAAAASLALTTTDLLLLGTARRIAPPANDSGHAISQTSSPAGGGSAT